MAKTLRPAPHGDTQRDLFVPFVGDIPLKDGVELMDFAAFRLSKRHTNAGRVIRHELENGTVVEVAGGAYGMATIWDYDLVLMVISALAHASQEWRKGNAEKPSRYYTPHTAEILKFCRREDNGQAYDRLSEALNRLQGTFIKITTKDGTKRRDGYFPLLGGAEIVSHTASGKIGSVRLAIPEWIYEAVTGHENPMILTINPDFFLIRGGLARFLYRYARKAAGRDTASISLIKLHARSGGQGALKRFKFEMRKIVSENNLPDYHLELDGDILRMTRREYLPKLAAKILEDATNQLRVNLD